MYIDYKYIYIYTVYYADCCIHISMIYFKRLICFIDLTDYVSQKVEKMTPDVCKEQSSRGPAWMCLECSNAFEFTSLLGHFEICNNCFRLVLVQFFWLLVSFFFSCGCIYFVCWTICGSRSRMGIGQSGCPWKISSSTAAWLTSWQRSLENPRDFMLFQIDKRLPTQANT